ncbi:MAG: hypothetical protein WAX69_25520 [Victivallales bacterium]
MNNTEKFIVENPDETKSIPLICSWCGEIISISKWKIRQDRKISPDYGICSKCLRDIRGRNCQLKIS